MQVPSLPGALRILETALDVNQDWVNFSLEHKYDVCNLRQYQFDCQELMAANGP